MTVTYRTQPWPFPGEKRATLLVSNDTAKVAALTSLVQRIITEGKPADPGVWDLELNRILGAKSS